MSLVSVQSDLFLFVLTFNIGGKVPETQEQTINFYTNTNCTKKYPQKLELKIYLFQVICWFQNRRAKFKRDMEELKKDVEKTSGTAAGPGPSPHHGPPPPMIRPPVCHPASMASLPGLVTSVPGLPPPHPGLGHHLPHPLILHSLAPHLLPTSMASPCRSPIGSPCGSSPPIRVEDSD